ncbi:MAG: DUF4876 domain-containing protein [Bacteroidaceae bacterium]|nr:DUF4876 domain-containing protein [Bacteroidaceae bacterium]
MNKKIFHTILTCQMAFTLTGCCNFDDATHEVSVIVQLQQPEDCVSDVSLEGKTVSIINGGQVTSVVTDASGKALFHNIIPDMYDISTSWSISADEYHSATNNQDAVSGAMIAGSVNSCLISGEGTIQLKTNLSANRDIVIGKVYYAGSRDKNNRNYLAGKYIELYNQSDDTIDVSGMYIGLTEAESTIAYTLDNIHTAFADSVVLLKQIYRIPAGSPYMVAPGGTVVICNSAIDHTTNDDYENDLTDADFEVKDVTGKYQNNPSTPAMEMIYQIYNGTSVMNLVQSGPMGVVIFRTDDDVASWQKVYPYGKTAGNQWVLCPVRHILDGMEALRNSSSGIDVKTKRLNDKIDAGYTYINATSGWNGETVYRKTMKRAADGHKILVDTNNSSNDFNVSQSIKPREYDE